MEVLLTVLFFFIVIGYVLKRVLPFILAWWLKSRMTKMYGPDFKGFSNTGYPNEGTSSNKKEGEVRVSGDSKSSKKIVDREIGDYVEFEEKIEEGKK